MCPHGGIRRRALLPRTESRDADCRPTGVRRRPPLRSDWVEDARVRRPERAAMRLAPLARRSPARLPAVRNRDWVQKLPKAAQQARLELHRQARWRPRCREQRARLAPEQLPAPLLVSMREPGRLGLTERRFPPSLLFSAKPQARMFPRRAMVLAPPRLAASRSLAPPQPAVTLFWRAPPRVAQSREAFARRSPALPPRLRPRVSLWQRHRARYRQ